MKRLFGLLPSSPKVDEKPKPTLDEGIEKLDTRAKSLEDKIKSLDSEIVKHRDTMTKSRNATARAQAKQRALQLMKQKKLYENQLMQLRNQSFNMEQARFNTEMMKDTMMQVDAMKGAKEAMSSQYGEINLDEIEDLQDDLEDMFLDVNEVQEIMSRSFGLPDGLDEADLEAELMDLEVDFEDEEVPSYLTDLEISNELPSVPRTTPALAQATAQPMGQRQGQ